MLLKRSIENGKTVFRNSDTNEIVDVNNSQSRSGSNLLVNILNIMGSLIIVFGLFIFAKTNELEFGIFSGLSGLIISVVVSIPFFFFAQVLQNLQEQTRLLNDILSNLQQPKSYFDK